MTAVRPGDRVEVRYTARLADGAVIDGSRPGAVLAFTAGGDEAIAGLSEAVIGMCPGETRTVRVTPERGFGPHDPALQQRVELEELPEGAAIGDPFVARAGAEQIQVWVREIGSGHAVVDGNHPLAGLTLEYDIELVSFRS